MRVGDIIKFTKTGRVATIINIGQDFWDDSSFTAKIIVHNWTVPQDNPGLNNPHLFRLGHLKQVAEVISARR